jgi:small subunit ribosomal protein S2
MPSNVTMKALLETGVHFGHRTPKWNPRMEPYIFTERNGIHIIDLQQTLVNINNYYDQIRDLVSKGGTVLFVGTKRQAQETMATEAGRCGMPYVNHRWLGGTLTNWRTIRDRIETLKKLEKRRDAGEFELLTKKEGLVLTRKIDKLNLRLGGIRDMKKVADMLLIVDTVRESTAVKEANILSVPVLALADTNSDPQSLDFIIPANDDAVRAIKLVISAFADAVIEGTGMRKGDDTDMNQATSKDAAYFYDKDAEEEVPDEAYLGASTIAKMRDAKLFEDEKPAATETPAEGTK